MILAGESQRTQRKPIPVPLCPPQIPHGLTLAPVVSSASFLKKTGSGTDSVTQNLVREGEVIVISMPGKKVPEHRSGLRPSEKELPEQHYGSFRHKNTWSHISYAVKTQT
jgi:hypothetical protein